MSEEQRCHEESKRQWTRSSGGGQFFCTNIKVPISNNLINQCPFSKKKTEEMAGSPTI